MLEEMPAQVAGLGIANWELQSGNRKMGIANCELGIAKMTMIARAIDLEPS